MLQKSFVAQVVMSAAVGNVVLMVIAKMLAMERSAVLIQQIQFVIISAVRLEFAVIINAVLRGIVVAEALVVHQIRCVAMGFAATKIIVLMAHIARNLVMVNVVVQVIIVVKITRIACQLVPHAFNLDYNEYVEI